MLLPSLFLSLTLFFVATAGEVREKIDPPYPLYRELHDNNYNFQIGELVTIDYQFEFSEFQNYVAERATPIKGDLLEDYRNNTHLYVPSSLCYLQQSDFFFLPSSILNLKSLLHGSQTVISYAIDETHSVAYILQANGALSKTSLDFKNTDSTKAFTKIMTFDQKPDSDEESLYLSPENGNLYIFIGRSLYVLRYQESMANKVEGYKEEKQPSKHVIINSMITVLQDYAKVNIYRLEKDQIGKLRAVVVQSVVSYKKDAQSQDVSIAPVDFWCSEAELWVLDENYGFYVYKRQGDFFRPFADYGIRYGNKKLFFERNGNTFQLVFQLANKQTYIAEMFLKREADNKEVLILNRFYDKVSGVNRIMFIQELMLVVGEEEVMAIPHSINRHLLNNTWWQNKKFIAQFGTIATAVHHIGNQTFQTAITGDEIIVHQVVRTPAMLKCIIEGRDILGRHSVLVMYNATLCSRSAWEAAEFKGDSYCEVHHSFNFEVTGKLYDRKTSLLMSVGMFMMGLMLAVAILTFIVKYKANKRRELERLRAVLKKRMEEIEMKEGAPAV